MNRTINERELGALLLVALLGLLLSGINPYDRLTWSLEVAPVIGGLPLLWFGRHRWPLTSLVYRLLLLEAMILLLGGHYTYARVPLGTWLQEWLELSRNHYDRLGHFTQGFAPALLVRELLIRNSPLLPGRWLFFLTVSVCLAFSACYELLEWWAALIYGTAAHEFLGTQGDVWDTQWDMFLALCGATLAVLTLSRQHNRQLRQSGWLT